MKNTKTFARTRAIRTFIARMVGIFMKEAKERILENTQGVTNGVRCVLCNGKKPKTSSIEAVLSGG
ncbi:MAG: hypothetical protein LBB79_08125 [Prevotellaceae bacterium]|nr:hypothetical protein [Prevotellaceae bacterium]